MNNLNDTAVKFEKINTNLNKENNMKKEINTITEERLSIVKKMCKEFKTTQKDKYFQTTKHKEFGNKYRGHFDLLTYVFYAYIRGTDFKKCTHDIKSDKYRALAEYIKSDFKYNFYDHKGKLFSVESLKKVMPSLKEHPEILEEFKNDFLTQKEYK